MSWNIFYPLLCISFQWKFLNFSNIIAHSELFSSTGKNFLGKNVKLCMPPGKIAKRNITFYQQKSRFNIHIIHYHSLPCPRYVVTLIPINYSILWIFCRLFADAPIINFTLFDKWNTVTKILKLWPYFSQNGLKKIWLKFPLFIE